MATEQVPWCGLSALLLVAVHIALCVDSDSQWYLAKNNDTLACVRSGDLSATFWKGPADQKGVSASSQRLQSPFDAFHCEPHNCPMWSLRGWQVKQSLGNMADPVFDVRWNALEQTETFKGDDLKMLSGLPEGSWLMHVSVRASRDAHFMLCDGHALSAGHRDMPMGCYLVVAQGWTELHSPGLHAVRRCPVGTLPIQDLYVAGSARYPTGECFVPKSSGAAADVWSPDSWNHFTLRWNGSELSVALFGQDTPFLKWNDPEPFTLRSLWVRSPKSAKAYWKLHNYTYYEAGQHASLQSDEVRVRDGGLCVHVLYRLPQDGVLTARANGAPLSAAPLKKDNRWHEARFEGTTTSRAVRFNVSASGGAVVGLLRVCTPGGDTSVLNLRDATDANTCALVADPAIELNVEAFNGTDTQWYLAKNNGTLACVRSGDLSATFWKGPADQKGISASSQRLQSPFDAFHCEPHNCPMWSLGGWQVKQSLGNMADPVFDVRWNALEQTETFKGDDLKMLSGLPEGSWLMHVSVRASRDAHFMLCDGHALSAGHRDMPMGCYLVVAQGWTELHSPGLHAVRRCPVGTLPIQDLYVAGSARYPRGECFVPKSSGAATDVWSLDSWNHFTLRWNGSELSVALFGQDTPFLKWNDPQPFTLHSLWVRSPKSAKAYWKLHNYTYYEAGQHASLQSDEVRVRDGGLCVHVLYRLPQDGVLTARANGAPLSAAPLKRDNRWHEARFEGTTTSRAVRFNVSASGGAAVGLLRVCTPGGDTSVLKLCDATDANSCSLVADPATELKIGAANGTDCPGCHEACLAANLSSACENTVLCFPNGAHTPSCACAEGFRGSNCTRVAEDAEPTPLPNGPAPANEVTMPSQSLADSSVEDNDVPAS